MLRGGATRHWSALALCVVVAACDEISGTGGAPAALPPGVRVALTDMGTRTYHGFDGGLYPGGSNTIPTDHLARGQAAAARIRRRAPDGSLSATGRYVLLSIGMSNTTQEFSAFIPSAAADAQVNKAALAIVDGAASGRTAEAWVSPTSADYDRIRDSRLTPAGFGEGQVQIVWLKVANPGPTVSLPSPTADAYRLVAQMGAILRALKTRYPNLQQVFTSSRIYAGYATTTLNPEPFAFESGLSVRWVVEAQIEQMRNGAVNARAGSLSEGTIAPWVAWGPYLWADGTTARSDGLTWNRSDLLDDGTHPSTSGRQKVATRLLEFLKASAASRCWFLAAQSC